MTPEFWRGKRVFLTGHTGFKGSWLALWLHRLGAEVTGFALPPATQPNLFELIRVGECVTDLRGDVRDPAALDAAMAAHPPEIVIHMAAQALVRPSYADPVGTYASNVMGTVHLLEAVRRADGVKAALVATSDKCYENRESGKACREGDPMGGHDPYSSSKGCAELVSSAYRSSYFKDNATSLATARAGNVIGGGDWAHDRLVPDAVRAALAGESIRLRHPDATRPWQHVLEPLSGYLTLAEHLYRDGQVFADGWNFGPDDGAVSVESVVRAIAQSWDAVHWERDEGAHPHEAHFLQLDCAKARDRLGWRPRLPLAEAISWTVGWYRAYQARADLRRLTEEQIDRYLDLMKT